MSVKPDAQMRCGRWAFNEPFGVLYALPTLPSLQAKIPVKLVPYNVKIHLQAIACASSTSCKTFPLRKTYKAHFYLEFAAELQRPGSALMMCIAGCMSSAEAGGLSFRWRHSHARIERY